MGRRELGKCEVGWRREAPEVKERVGGTHARAEEGLPWRSSG